MRKRRLRATLPGSVVRRGQRWWWRVVLPGEHQRQARSLRPRGQPYGVTSLRKAGGAALSMWQLAITQQATARAREEASARYRHKARLWARRIKQVRLQAQEEIQRGIAAYQKRIAVYKKQARAWGQRVRQARMEAKKGMERRVAACQQQAKGLKDRLKSQAEVLKQTRAQIQEAAAAERLACSRRIKACKAAAARARQRAVAKVRAEANRALEEQKAQYQREMRACKKRITVLLRRSNAQAGPAKRQPAKRRTHNQAKSKVQHRRSTAMRVAAARRAKTHTDIVMQVETELDKSITKVEKTAHCECCFRNGVLEGDLTVIDSGQRLCPDCLEALKQKVAQIDMLES